MRWGGAGWGGKAWGGVGWGLRVWVGWYEVLQGGERGTFEWGQLGRGGTWGKWGSRWEEGERQEV